MAANHDEMSIECHSRNYPNVDHRRADLSNIDSPIFVDPASLPPARVMWAHLERRGRAYPSMRPRPTPCTAPHEHAPHAHAHIWAVRTPSPPKERPCPNAEGPPPS